MNSRLVCKCKYLQQYQLFYSSFGVVCDIRSDFFHSFSSQVNMILQRQLRQTNKNIHNYQLLTPTRSFSSRCFLFLSISAFSISISRRIYYKYNTFNSTNNRKHETAEPDSMAAKQTHKQEVKHFFVEHTSLNHTLPPPSGGRRPYTHQPWK